jgi:hypothetical protein
MDLPNAAIRSFAYDPILRRQRCRRENTLQRLEPAEAFPAQNVSSGSSVEVKPDRLDIERDAEPSRARDRFFTHEI